MANHTCTGKTCEICAKKKRMMIIVGLGIILIGGIVVFSRKDVDDEKNSGIKAVDTTVGIVSDTEKSIVKTVEITNKEGVDTSSSFTKEESGQYLVYSPEKIGMTERTILSFSATWCPSCVAFDKNIVANKASIPADVTVLKVDYDTHKDLRKQYGVRSQHTFVEVGKDGKSMKTIVGSATLKMLIKDFTL